MDKSDYFTAMVLDTPLALWKLTLLVLALGLFWRTQNKLTKFDDDHELFDKSNYAYLLHRLSLMGAFIIGCVPITERERTGGFWPDTGWMLAEIAWVFIALLLVRIVVDKILLPKIDNRQALLDGNIALGAVEAGFYIGFGAILNGSLSGSSPSTGLGVASTVVFGVLGLAVMVGLFFFHEWVTPWHLRRNIQDGDMAASLEVAGMLAAVGIVVREGVAGDFTKWGESLFAFAMTVLFAVVFLYALRWLIDLVIFPRRTIRSILSEQEVAAASLLAALCVIGAIQVGLVVRQL